MSTLDPIYLPDGTLYRPLSLSNTQRQSIFSSARKAFQDDFINRGTFEKEDLQYYLEFRFKLEELADDLTSGRTSWMSTPDGAHSPVSPRSMPPPRTNALPGRIALRNAFNGELHEEFRFPGEVTVTNLSALASCPVPLSHRALTSEDWIGRIKGAGAMRNQLFSELFATRAIEDEEQRQEAQRNIGAKIESNDCISALLQETVKAIILVTSNSLRGTQYENCLFLKPAQSTDKGKAPERSHSSASASASASMRGI